MHSFKSLIAFAALGIVLSGCNVVDRLATVGQQPKLTTVQNPVQNPNYRPVSLPMPTQRPDVRHANSLWRAGARQFFKDQRAAGGVAAAVVVGVAVGVAVHGGSRLHSRSHGGSGVPQGLTIACPGLPMTKGKHAVLLGGFEQL